MYVSLHPNLDKMATNRTFTMLKPDAIENGYTGKILDMIIQAGFSIKAMKYTKLTKEQAEKFYEVHAERPFYGELVEYMTSGPIVAAILEKENAVAEFRALIGATDPAEAAEGTIRKYYAESKGRNAVHGSDSDENAAIEGVFSFQCKRDFLIKSIHIRGCLKFFFENDYSTFLSEKRRVLQPQWNDYGEKTLRICSQNKFDLQ